MTIGHGGDGYPACGYPGDGDGYPAGGLLADRLCGDLDSAGVAVLAERVAALSRAGLPLPRVWAVLGDQDDESGAVARRVRRAVNLGRSSAEGLRAAAPGNQPVAWMAAACAASETGGAPLAGVLETVASTLRAEAAAARARGVALAGPKATMTVLSWLPLGGLGLGLLIGADSFTVLVTTAPGWLFLAAGSLLWWFGRRWMRVLLRRAEAATDDC